MPALTPEEAKITLSEGAPPLGYVELRKLSVKSGEGCGVFGHAGSREDAEQKLRKAAAEAHATYVRITNYAPPRPNHECVEHEHQLSGVAYAGAQGRVGPASAVVLQDFEGNEGLGRPAPNTDRSSLTLALVAGEGAGSALSVTYTCSGSEPGWNLDVWTNARVRDWTAATALRFRIAPDTALSLSVSLLDGNHTSLTQKTAQLTPGVWQTVTLPLGKFLRAPSNPSSDHPAAPVDLHDVAAFGFAPSDCQSGHFSIDDLALVR